MRNNRLDDLIVLHVYQEEIAKIDIRKIPMSLLLEKTQENKS